MLAVFLSACNADTKESGHGEPQASLPVPLQSDQSPKNSEQAELPAKTESVLPKLVNREMIGQTVRMFEKLAGDPQAETEKGATYLVENCKIDTEVEDRIVRVMTVWLNKDCNADFSSLQFYDTL